MPAGTDTKKAKKKRKGDEPSEEQREGAAAQKQRPSVAAHPRAALNVARAKGWGGLLGFVAAGYLSLSTCTLAAAAARALVAGVACYLVAWAGAVFLWRQLVALEHAGAVAEAAARRAPRPPAPAHKAGAASGARRGGAANGTRRSAAADAAQEDASERDAAPAPRAAPEHRRANVRVQAQRPVIAYVGADREEVLTFTLDLSAGGMLLAGLEELAQGELLEFELTLDPEDPAIEGAATVLRTDPEGRCAVAFKSIGREDELRLVKYVFDYQRGEQTAA